MQLKENTCMSLLPEQLTMAEKTTEHYWMHGNTCAAVNTGKQLRKGDRTTGTAQRELHKGDAFIGLDCYKLSSTASRKNI